MMVVSKGRVVHVFVPLHYLPVLPKPLRACLTRQARSWRTTHDLYHFEFSKKRWRALESVVHRTWPGRFPVIRMHVRSITYVH
jgi:hypothetical protein